MTIVLGLTGGIASGKSTVSQMLQTMGAQIVDADIGARAVVEPGTPGLAALTEHFGESVLQNDGSLDRHALGRLIFSDSEARRALEEIIHPRVFEWMQKQLTLPTTPRAPLVVLDVPLLFETQRGLAFCNYTAVVWTPVDVQLARLMQRDNLNAVEAAQRIAAQLSLDQKRDMADFVIDNSSTLAHTQAQVEQLWNQLMSC